MILSCYVSYTNAPSTETPKDIAFVAVCYVVFTSSLRREGNCKYQLSCTKLMGRRADKKLSKILKRALF